MRVRSLDISRLYAAGILIGLFVLIYALAFFAGTAGSSVNGNAINVERNSITIALSEEPPQLDSTRSTDASSFIVLAHTMEGSFPMMIMTN